MRRFILIVGLFALGAMFMAPVSYAQEKTMPEKKEAMKKREGSIAGAMRMRMELRTAMRRLWIDHLVYHRNFLISALADLADADAVAQRLLKNQDDIGNAVKPFYGEDAGNKLATLLRAHITIGADVIKASKMGDKAGADKAMASWTANADEIVSFLSGANPNWNKTELTEMMHKHLELLNGECTSRLQKDWAADIKYFDDAMTEILKMADYLTMGIENQFPDKFKR